MPVEDRSFPLNAEDKDDLLQFLEDICKREPLVVSAVVDVVLLAMQAESGLRRNSGSPPVATRLLFSSTLGSGAQ